MKILSSLEKRSPLFWITTGIIFVAGVCAADVLTGKELSLSSLYLIAIFIVSWLTSKRLGLVLSGICTIAWVIADVLVKHVYPEPILLYWNAGVRLGFFVIVTLLVPALKALEHEKELARTDYMTGAANRLYFFEITSTELDRARRYHRPFTVAYIDLDDLKVINDKLGHKAGDDVLCAVVERARRELRKIDTIARLGGDEFVLLLPETDQVAARDAITRIQAALLDEMVRHQWPVTFSIGVLTCVNATMSTDELIRQADDLMYTVKHSTKNSVAYGVCGESIPAASK
jgi:diguanylate cyclase (GGDEF)-like protein